MKNRLASLFGKRFWIAGYAALAGGLFLPIEVPHARQAIVPVLGLVLFFSCLKLELASVFAALRGRTALGRVAGLTALKLVVLPVTAWLLARLVAPSFSLGVLLVAAMPAGMASVAFTDVHRGHVALALVLLVSTSLLCPLTVPLLLEAAIAIEGASIPAASGGDLAGRAAFIALLLVVPFALAQLLRRVAPRFVARHAVRFTPLALVALTVMIFLATTATRAAWFARGFKELLPPLLATSLASAVFLAAAVALGRRRPRADAVACACGAVFLNHGLGVAFGLGFFGQYPTVYLPAILMVVPMVWVVTAVAGVVGWHRDR